MCSCLYVKYQPYAPVSFPFAGAMSAVFSTHSASVTSFPSLVRLQPCLQTHAPSCAPLSTIPEMSVPHSSQAIHPLCLQAHNRTNIIKLSLKIQENLGLPHKTTSLLLQNRQAFRRHLHNPSRSYAYFVTYNKT